MAQVDQAALHNFVNGETVTDQMLDQNFEIVRVAQNETDTKTASHKNNAILDHPDKSVTTAKLADGSVTEVKLADSNVTTSKIADYNVTTAKVADNAIVTSKILDSNVTTSKIADKAVTFDKLGMNLQASLDLEKEWIATANQTVFDLSDVGTYPVGVHALEFIVGGVPQSESAYIQSSPTTITTVEGVAAGVRVRARWRMGLMPTTTVGHQSTHQLGGLDELDVTTLKNYQPMIADKLGILSYFKSIKEYGAKGDGITDDSTAFTNAFNSGYDIRLDKGKTYIVNNVHINTQNLVLYGNGATVKTSGSTNSVFFIDATSSNILIRDLSFIGLADGTNANPAGINIVSSGLGMTRGSSANNIEIANCKFLGGFVFSIIATGTTGLKIHDCYGTGNYYVQSVSAGGYFILVQTCYDVEIYRNRALATPTDRHAVYISCDGTITGDKGNEDVRIHHNIFDWRNCTTVTGQENVIATRSTRRMKIHDNITFGGFTGIAINPSHADYTDIDIHDNHVLQLRAGVSELYGIGCDQQDKGGSWWVKNLKIHDNEVQSSSNKVHGFHIIRTDGFEIQNNKAILAGSGTYGIEVYNGNNGIIGGNNIKGDGTCYAGIMFDGSNSDNIDILPNRLTGFSSREKVVGTTLTNSRHRYARTFEVDANGSGSITVLDDNDNLVVSVVSQGYGCDITFNSVWTVKQGYANITLLSGDAAIIQNRSANTSTNVLSLNFKDKTGASMPLANNVLYFIVTINS